MTLGEKIRSLRKENNYSQEDLAEILDVSRQAVSKWESDKGIPELDKLIQISNTFNVTMDYLVKNNIQNETSESSNKYYVDEYTAKEYLSYKKKGALRIALGVALIILCNIADVFTYSDDIIWFKLSKSYFEISKISSVLYWLIMGIGFALILWQILLPKKYLEIESRELIFDRSFIRDFRYKAEKHRNNYIGVIILGVILLFISQITDEYYYIVRENSIFEGVIESVNWLLNGIAFGLIIYSGLMIKAEKLIAWNDQYKKKNYTKGDIDWKTILLFVIAAALIIDILFRPWSLGVILFIILIIFLLKERRN